MDEYLVNVLIRISKFYRLQSGQNENIFHQNDGKYVIKSRFIQRIIESLLMNV